MPRGGISYEGKGYFGDSFMAGAGIKALVAAGGVDARTGLPLGKDLVKGLPVVVTDNDTVDIGSAGDVPYGVIVIYEYDGMCTVQSRGKVTGVKVVDAGVTPGRICLLDGNGKLKDTADGIGVKQSMTKAVATEASISGTATVTITAAGSSKLAEGKVIEVTLDTTSTSTNAAAIRAALNEDSDITDYFTVGGTAANVILTRKVTAANEEESFAFALGTAVGAAMGDTTDVEGVPDRKTGLPIFINTNAAAKTATIDLG